MTRRQYIAISYGIPGDVISSQFLEYFSLLKQHDVHVKVLLLLPGSFMFSRNARRLMKQRLKGNNYSVEIHCLPAPWMDSMPGLILQFIFLRFYLGVFNRHDVTVIHARNLVSANIANRFKGSSSRIKYIYDVRGDFIGEYEYSANKRGDASDLIASRKNRLMKHEKDAVDNASHIVCVSGALKKLLVERYAAEEGKFVVIPCCADEDLFKFTPEKREACRQELNLSNKIVLIYSGGMDKWHCAERIFQLAGQVLKRMEQAYFIALTQQREEAESLAAQYLAKGRYQIKTVNRMEVPKFLLASDAGIVLRELDPVNKVASPTKIAEYLISGLPVILTREIGDYSKFVAEQNVGCVLEQASDEIDSHAEQVCNFLAQLEVNDKKRVSDIGSKHFSKSGYVEVLKNIYND